MEDVTFPTAALAEHLVAHPLKAVARFSPPGSRSSTVRAWRKRAATAAERGRRRQAARAKLMLRLGFVHTTERSLHGLVSLHAAVACGPSGAGALDVILAAVASHPERERLLGIRDWRGLSALAHAVQADWGDGVRKLVAAGANVMETYSDKSIDEWEKIPGVGANLLSFAVALDHMKAFQALVECGADVGQWDRNGMRPVHIAVICGNLPAVRDLLILDGGADVSRRKAMELYTVREKYEKGQGSFPMQRGDEEEDNAGSEPVGDEGPGDSMRVEMLDDEEGGRGDSISGWGFGDGGDPNQSRDVYRTLTSELDDFDLENLGGEDDGDGNTTDGPHAEPDFTDDDDDDGDDENDIGDSEDDDDDLPDLMDEDSAREYPTKKVNAKADEEDAAFTEALMTALGGALAPALAKADKIRQDTAEPSESKPSRKTGDDSATGASSSAGRGHEEEEEEEEDGEAHFVSHGVEGETHIVRVGDIVRISHMPGENGDLGDEDRNQLGRFVLSAVLKAINMSRKIFYGATLLHLAVKRQQHEVLRFLLESAPGIQSVDDRMNNGLTALHIAAEDDDPVAIELLVSAGANVQIRSDTDSTTPLMRAAKLGNRKCVEILIAKGASVTDEDDNGGSVLHYAAEAKNGAEYIELLVEAGANVNAQAADGSTPVYAAVAHGHTSVFKKLLDVGGDPSIANYDGSVPLGFIATKGMEQLADFAEFVAKNPQLKEKIDIDVTIGDQGTTALHMAAAEGCARAIQALLDAGADCNKLNEFGLSALILVARADEVSPEDRLECISRLVDAGANVKLAGDEGKTALHFVTYLGEANCVELLLKKGADPSAPTKQKTPLHLVALENFADCAELLIKYGANLNAQDDIKMTPVMYAALRHSTRVLKVLINAGADLAHRAEAGMTALHISSVANHPDAEETVRLLCEAGAPMDVKDNQGMYPIHLHGDFGRTRCVRRMLMAGCDPDIRCGAGFTPLIRACNARMLIHDNLTLVRVLLRAGADVNAKNDNDNTVMSYLGDTKDHELIRVMLAAGADINVADKQGDTPLHEAAMGEHDDTVALLARRGADVNARNHKKETALFIAAQQGYKEVVKALLAKGLETDITIPNAQDVTPYQAARDKGHDDIASMLLDATGLRLSQFAPISTYDVKSPKVSMDGPDGFRRRDSGRRLCVTCQEGLRYGEEIRELPCGHYFHDPCILPWLGGEKMTNNRTCPVCKQLVAPDELFPAQD